MVESGARCRVVGVIAGKHGRDVMFHTLVEEELGVYLGVVYHIIWCGVDNSLQVAKLLEIVSRVDWALYSNPNARLGRRYPRYQGKRY